MDQDNSFRINSRVSAVLIFLLPISLFSGLVLGYFLGQNEKANTETVEFAATPTPTTITQASPITDPTISPELTPTASTNRIVSVPKDWKKFTIVDRDFGRRVSLSLPEGYSFRFTGSETFIQNDSDATELWFYTNSLYPNEDGVILNHYNKESRRVWYENYLESINHDSVFKSITEVPISSSSYLKIITAESGTHYLYVQNGILGVFSPMSEKANSKEAEIPKYFGEIFSSIKQERI